jgi:lysine-N-methylase
MTLKPEQVRPHYASAFRCIGPDCEDTCCRGMWVLIDKLTYEKYQAFPAGEIRSLVEQYVTLKTEDASDALYAQINATPSSDCPFLGTDRLCGVQKQFGSESLSATCSIYPRVLNRVKSELEVSLYLSCPEAARLVLLNEHSAAEPQASVDSGDFRTDQFSALANNGGDSIHKPFSYFWEVRALTVDLLRDRSRPLWQRLFLLGVFCREIDKSATPEQDATVPRIVSDVREIMEAGALRTELEKLAARPAIQLDLVLRLTDERIREGSIGERFMQCFQMFIAGIGYSEESTLASDVQRYVDAEERFCRPFLDRHPFIMENYLVNYVFRTLFPFGREASAHFTPQGIFGEYLLMATQYCLLRGLLIGMAGGYQETFSTEHVVKLVQSFSKAVEHNPVYLKKIVEFVGSRKLDTPEGIAILLK